MILTWSARVLFGAYVGLLIVAGAWGALFGHVDQSWLLGLDMDAVDEQVRANVLSQYRFLRAIELGFGLFAVLFRREIFEELAFNRLFLAVMSAGVAARVVSLAVDGMPRLLMLAFMGIELAGVVAIYAETRRKLRVAL